jgi:hypothetical protein
MSLTPIFDYLLPATIDIIGSIEHDWFSFVVIHGAFSGFGTLRIVAGVVFVVNTGSTQKFFGLRSIQRDTRMTESLQRGLAVRTDDQFCGYRLVTARAIRH